MFTHGSPLLKMVLLLTCGYSGSPSELVLQSELVKTAGLGIDLTCSDLALGGERGATSDKAM